MYIAKPDRRPLPLRAFERVEQFFREAGELHTDIARHVLGKFKRPAEKAQEKVDNPPDPDKVAWRRTYKECDRLFSIFIRLRDTRGPMDDYRKRWGYCVSCKDYLPWAKLQCGHWQVRERWGTRWHPWNCHAQCGGCNNWGKGGGKGETEKHRESIVRIHGVGAPDRILHLAATMGHQPSIDTLRKLKDKILEETEKLIRRLEKEDAEVPTLRLDPSLHHHGLPVAPPPGQPIRALPSVQGPGAAPAERSGVSPPLLPRSPAAGEGPRQPAISGAEGQASR